MPQVFTPYPDHSKSVRSVGDLLLAVGTITFTGSYPSGGEVPSISSGGTGLKALFKQKGEGRVLAVLTSAKGNSLEYDEVNDKLKLFGAANTEVAAAAYNAALLAAPVPVVVLGR
jgi:hypothetical protein